MSLQVRYEFLFRRLNLYISGNSQTLGRASPFCFFMDAIVCGYPIGKATSCWPVVLKISPSDEADNRITSMRKPLSALLQ